MVRQDEAHFSLSLKYLSFKRLMRGKSAPFLFRFTHGRQNFAESKTLVKLECVIPKN